ncbi:proteoglycan 4-like isoform X2 [Leguminivora glycinivorella]|uniref:proteoglycan 4-like isoform X2 n=1 Tax=Leguminivora glycinivorella TaxID=1035111 RepID=UPI00200C16CF|nr:proteoglycan 4-like isoform X2 [Leguminivora glycinivorella]
MERAGRYEDRNPLELKLMCLMIKCIRPSVMVSASPRPELEAAVCRIVAQLMCQRYHVLFKLWSDLRAATLRKLRAHLVRGDLSTSYERLSTLEWAVVDLLLLYDSSLNVAAYFHPAQLVALERTFKLVQSLHIEQEDGPVSPDKWTQAAEAYCKNGAELSAVALQRRWHEMKIQARQRAGGPLVEDLHQAIIHRYPHVTQAELPTWRDLVTAGKVAEPTVVPSFRPAAIRRKPMREIEPPQEPESEETDDTEDEVPDEEYDSSSNDNVEEPHCDNTSNVQANKTCGKETDKTDMKVEPEIIEIDDDTPSINDPVEATKDIDLNNFDAVIVYDSDDDVLDVQMGNIVANAENNENAERNKIGHPLYEILTDCKIERYEDSKTILKEIEDKSLETVNFTDNATENIDVNEENSMDIVITNVWSEKDLTPTVNDDNIIEIDDLDVENSLDNLIENDGLDNVTKDCSDNINSDIASNLKTAKCVVHLEFATSKIDSKLLMRPTVSLERINLNPINKAETIGNPQKNIDFTKLVFKNKHNDDKESLKLRYENDLLERINLKPINESEHSEPVENPEKTIDFTKLVFTKNHNDDKESLKRKNEENLLERINLKPINESEHSEPVENPQTIDNKLVFKKNQNDYKKSLKRKNNEDLNKECLDFVDFTKFEFKKKKDKESLNRKNYEDSNKECLKQCKYCEVLQDKKGRDTRKVKLPDLEKVRNDNKGILTAEVAPTVANTSEDPPPSITEPQNVFRCGCARTKRENTHAFSNTLSQNPSIDQQQQDILINSNMQDLHDQEWNLNVASNSISDLMLQMTEGMKHLKDRIRYTLKTQGLDIKNKSTDTMTGKNIETKTRYEKIAVTGVSKVAPVPVSPVVTSESIPVPKPPPIQLPIPVPIAPKVLTPKSTLVSKPLTELPKRKIKHTKPVPIAPKVLKPKLAPVPKPSTESPNFICMSTRPAPIASLVLTPKFTLVSKPLTELPKRKIKLTKPVPIAPKVLKPNLTPVPKLPAVLPNLETPKVSELIPTLPIKPSTTKSASERPLTIAFPTLSTSKISTQNPSNVLPCSPKKITISKTAPRYSLPILSPTLSMSNKLVAAPPTVLKPKLTSTPIPKLLTELPNLEMPKSSKLILTPLIKSSTSKTASKRSLPTLSMSMSTTQNSLEVLPSPPKKITFLGNYYSPTVPFPTQSMSKLVLKSLTSNPTTASNLEFMPPSVATNTRLTSELDNAPAIPPTISKPTKYVPVPNQTLIPKPEPLKSESLSEPSASLPNPPIVAIRSEPILEPTESNTNDFDLIFAIYTDNSTVDSNDTLKTSTMLNTTKPESIPDLPTTLKPSVESYIRQSPKKPKGPFDLEFVNIGTSKSFVEYNGKTKVSQSTTEQMKREEEISKAVELKQMKREIRKPEIKQMEREISKAVDWKQMKSEITKSEMKQMEREFSKAVNWKQMSEITKSENSEMKREIIRSVEMKQVQSEISKAVEMEQMKSEIIKSLWMEPMPSKISRAVEMKDIVNNNGPWRMEDESLEEAEFDMSFFAEAIHVYTDY